MSAGAAAARARPRRAVTADSGPVPVCASGCVFACLLVCLFVWLLVCLFVCLSEQTSHEERSVPAEPCTRRAIRIARSDWRRQRLHTIKRMICHRNRMTNTRNGMTRPLHGVIRPLNGMTGAVTALIRPLRRPISTRHLLHTPAAHMKPASSVPRPFSEHALPSASSPPAGSPARARCEYTQYPRWSRGVP
jgi:hypothetical protein